MVNFHPRSLWIVSKELDSSLPEFITNSKAADRSCSKKQLLSKFYESDVRAILMEYFFYKAYGL